MGFGLPTIAALAAVLTTSVSGLIVQTKYGELEGAEFYLKGSSQPGYHFLNIPFAAPPVGQLRFKPPQPVPTWDGIRDAAKHGYICPQQIWRLPGLDIAGNMTTNEDCLALNIYTPNVNGQLTVMVFIHGGSFVRGDAQSYHADALVLTENVVVVVIQYRLGVLGFLSTADENVPGNMGLQDQIAALRWVKENIASFGGNAEDVTVFGESAGSISISALLINPDAEGLFQKAIMQSGAVDGPYPIVIPTSMASQIARQFAQTYDCSSENIPQMVECLQQQMPESLVTNSQAFTWTLVVDGTIIPADPFELYSDGKFHRNVDIMMGVLETEGYLLASALTPQFNSNELSFDTFKAVVQGTLALSYPQVPDKIDQMTEAIGKEYDHGKSAEQVRMALTDFTGDIIITIPTLITAKKIKDVTKANLFFYEMRYRPSISKIPSWVIMDHGQDLIYTFGLPILAMDPSISINFTEADRNMSRLVMKYWTNFARTGDPNGGGLTNWPTYKDDEAYITLKLKPEPSTGYKEDQVKLWTEGLSKIMEGELGADLIVDTKYGQLEGAQFYVDGSSWPGYKFLNIPFAAPPVGQLRFKPPQPVPAWDGIRDATKHGNACSQVNMTLPYVGGSVKIAMSEDCLMLNIFTPYIYGHRPVMVFIHGGSQITGSAEPYRGEALALLENVVVVVIQYRLGVFGYLTTGDENVPGNLAIRDQIAALRWVQENIASFGGSPDDVTIFGESAGSTCVSAMLVSPEAEGLFQRAIMQSGSLAGWQQSVIPSSIASNMAQQLAQTLNCSSEYTFEMVECLQQQSTEMLISPPAATTRANYRWFPVLDGTILPDDPLTLFSKGKFHKDVDVIIGVCHNEGYLLAGIVSPTIIYAPELSTDIFKAVVKQMLAPSFPKIPDKLNQITNTMIKEYLQGKSTEQVRESIADIVGDTWITIPTVITAKKIKDSTKGNIFFYEFKIRPSISTKPSWMVTDHAEDLLYTFGFPLLGPDPMSGMNFSESDKNMSRMVLEYWTNFAKTGDPNGFGLPEWPSYKDNEAYITLKLEPESSTAYKEERVKLWTEGLSKITKEEKKPNLSKSTTHTIDFITLMVKLICTWVLLDFMKINN